MKYDKNLKEYLDNIDVMDIKTLENIMVNDGVNLDDLDEVSEWIQDNNFEILDMLEISREYEPEYWEIKQQQVDSYSRYVVLHHGD